MTEIVNGIEIKDRVYDPYVDLYVIFGLAVDPSPEPFSLSWQKRGQPDLFETQSFPDKKSALTAFTDAVNHSIAPVTFNTLDHDDQKDAVYKWEDIHVYPHAKKISQKDARAIVQKISHDFGIKPPKLLFIEEGQSSRYNPEDHEIELSHRENLPLLHEMAHAILYKECESAERELVDHGPQFMWVLLDLYSDYADFNRQYLTLTANQYGLLGDVNASHALDGKHFKMHGPKLEDL